MFTDQELGTNQASLISRAQTTQTRATRMASTMTNDLTSMHKDEH